MLNKVITITLKRSRQTQFRIRIIKEYQQNHSGCAIHLQVADKETNNDTFNMQMGRAEKNSSNSFTASCSQSLKVSPRIESLDNGPTIFSHSGPRTMTTSLLSGF